MTESVNRAFMYGESVFTTMRMVNSSLCDWEYHFDRIKRGVEFVFGPFVEGEDWIALFRDRLETRSQSESGDKVIRITIYREQVRGLLRPNLISVHDLKLHFWTAHYDPSFYEGKSKLRTCPAIPRPIWWPSFLKSGNYLETILSQKMYLKEHDDDLLFLSPRDTVLESSIANIFVVRHNHLYTAPLGPNVLDGVMRRKIIEVALEYFKSFNESESSLDQVLKADAVFGCNSLRGPFLIESIDDYDVTYDEDFLEKFESLRGRVFK